MKDLERLGRYSTSIIFFTTSASSDLSYEDEMVTVVSTIIPNMDIIQYCVSAFFLSV